MTTIRLSTKRHVVLEAGAFSSLLQIETRRASRSRKSLVLMLLDIAATHDIAGIVATLSSCVRATDHIGWHEVDKRLGIVFTEIETAHREHIARLLTAKIAKVLEHQVQLNLSDHLTISVLPSGRNYLSVTTGST